MSIQVFISLVILAVVLLVAGKDDDGTGGLSA